MARVLLLEPDVLLAKTYRTYLQRQGHQVDVCTQAQAAISQADKRLPDLVVVELQLIDHSGIEFLYELRSYSDWQSIPAIIQTHVPPAEFNRNWQLLKGELGVTAYLYKPQTKLADLGEAVAEQLTAA